MLFRRQFCLALQVHQVCSFQTCMHGGGGRIRRFTERRRLMSSETPWAMLYLTDNNLIFSLLE